MTSPEQRDQPRQQCPNGRYIRTKKFSISAPAGQFECSLKTIAEGVGVIYGHKMKQLLKNRTETTYSVPTLASSPSEQDKLVWGKEYDMYLKDECQYKSDKAKVFALIHNHCNDPLKQAIKVTNEFKTAEEQRDVLRLLKIVEHAVNGAHDKKHQPAQAIQALKKFLLVHQGEDESLVGYLKRFTALKNCTEALFGTVLPPVLVAIRSSKSTGCGI